MAKTKNKKQGQKKNSVAEKVASTKVKEGKINPFEIHFNRQKHVVLGQKVQGEKGKPGISKAKALKKRKLTLLRELKTRTKTNEFLDRRIGEKTRDMSADDRLAARFATERKKQSRKTLFNLDDTAELTHMGQTLSQIEKYEDPRSDDEDDDAALGADFVKGAHFGGGLLSQGEKRAQSRKEWIDQMIADSKKRKYEARKLREETLEMTDKLDEDYQQLMQVLKDSKLIRLGRRDDDDEPTVTDQTSKSTSALVSRDLDKPTSAATERGVAGAEPVESGGQTDTEAAADGAPAAATDRQTDAGDDYDALVRQLTFEPRARASDRTKTSDEVERAERERLRALEEARLRRMRAEDQDKDHQTAGTTEHRSADDLDDSYTPREEPAERLELIGDRLMVMSTEGSAPFQLPQSGLTDRQRRKLARRSREQDGASDGEDTAEQTVSAPSVRVPGYKKLSAQLRQLLPVEQAAHIRQLIERLDPQLSSGNRAQLARLYRLLLRHITDSCSGTPSAAQTGVHGDSSGGFSAAQTGVRVADVLAPLLYDLTQRLGDLASSEWTRLLRRRHRLYLRPARRRSPGLETLLLLRLCGQLFPGSDRRHPVTMPAMLLLCRCLAECPVRSRSQAAAGLLAVSLLHEFTSLSGRYVPETVGFLQSLLYLAVSSSRQTQLAHLVLRPQLPAGPHTNLLHLDSDCSAEPLEARLSLTEVQTSDSACDDRFRVTALHVALSLVKKLVKQHQQLPAAPEIFQPIRQMLSAIDSKMYPPGVRELLISCTEEIGRLSDQKKVTLERSKRRPKPLRLFEPAIEENFDGRKRRFGTAEKREHDKLVHKYKRQMRSTVREVRRDTAFLARQKLADMKYKDNERKRKLKNLMSSLANQEGDFKRMKRMK